MPWKYRRHLRIARSQIQKLWVHLPHDERKSYQLSPKNADLRILGPCSSIGINRKYQKAFERWRARAVQTQQWAQRWNHKKQKIARKVYES